MNGSPIVVEPFRRDQMGIGEGGSRMGARELNVQMRGGSIRDELIVNGETQGWTRKLK
jgi:hypothetical protein